jgi:hypothetical protein
MCGPANGSKTGLSYSGRAAVVAVGNGREAHTSGSGARAKYLQLRKWCFLASEAARQRTK